MEDNNKPAQGSAGPVADSQPASAPVAAPVSPAAPDAPLSPAISEAPVSPAAAPVSPAAAPATEGKWPGAFSAISRSFSQVLNNMQPVLLYASASVVVGILAFFMTGGLSPEPSDPSMDSALVNGLALVVSVIFLLANRTYALAVAEKRKITIAEYMRFDSSKFICLAIALILSYLVWGLSFLLFLIPIIWTLPWFYLAQFVAADKGGDPISAMKEAKALAQNHKGKVWGIVGATILIFILSLIPLFILVIIPLVGLLILTFLASIFELTLLGAYASLYRWLQHNRSAEPVTVTGPAPTPAQSPTGPQDPASPPPPVSPANLQ